MPPPTQITPGSDMARVLERLTRIETQLDRAIQDLAGIGAGMVRRQELEALNRRLDEIEAEVVTKDEFEPIKRVVYGGVGLALTMLLGALLTMVVNRGAP